MVVSPISIDPRAVSPLIGRPEDGLGRFPRDTLHRVSVTLNLLGDLVGQYGGSEEAIFSDGQKFALALQLSGMADLVAALADSLATQKVTLYPDEIPIQLPEEERNKLQILAARGETSVSAVAAAFIKERLAAVSLGGVK
jgi:hypothetical protein